MNWVNSKALTPLKRDFLEAFFERNQSFYITGGSALGVFYLEHRFSYDLDFFTHEQPSLHGLVNVVTAVCEEISSECRSITISPEFHRFQLTREPDSEIVDFVFERVPQIDERKKRFGKIRVDTLREIFVNKICMLLSRCEVKDLVDLFFLHEKGFDVSQYFSDAYRKEAAMDPAMISFLLSNVRITETPEYMIAPLDLAEFKTFLASLQKKMAIMAHPDKKSRKE